MVKLPSLSNTEQYIQHTRHKEEAEGRIKTDQADRQRLRDTLDVCIDPLEYASQPEQSAHPDVNADNAVNLGHRAMENFILLPSRQASCHNGCEEEPRVSWQGTCL